MICLISPNPLCPVKLHKCRAVNHNLSWFRICIHTFLNLSLAEQKYIDHWPSPQCRSCKQGALHKLRELHTPPSKCKCDETCVEKSLALSKRMFYKIFLNSKFFPRMEQQVTKFKIPWNSELCKSNDYVNKLCTQGSTIFRA